MTKAEVRRIAQEEGLPNATKPSSTGLCFVGERDFSKFIRQYVKPDPGRFLDVDDQPLDVPYHDGQMFLTIGQRARIGGLPEAVYVSFKRGKDVRVVPGRNHPDLYRESFTIEKPNWIAMSAKHKASSKQGLECLLSIRYRSALGRCRVKEDLMGFTVEMIDLHRAVTPGQYAVFYDGDRVLGSGEIVALGPSLHKLGKPVPVASPDDFLGELIITGDTPEDDRRREQLLSHPF